MLKPHLLTATTTALIVTAVGVPIAFAQVVACVGGASGSSGPDMTYQGYSDKPAEQGAKGTSTAHITNSTVQAWNDDCTGFTTTTTVSKDYTDGPGKSGQHKPDHIISTECEATGTAVCP